MSERICDAAGAVAPTLGAASLQSTPGSAAPRPWGMRTRSSCGARWRPHLSS